ncbi:TPA: BspA family leucine-rich repeat surface protein [Enterococcus faecalis]|nr:BspA family leucine-rich repeat surface protein [Enterococcus faecalis]
MNLKKFKYITLASVLLGNVLVSSGVVLAENSEKTMTEEQSKKALEIINNNEANLSNLEGKINESTNDLKESVNSDKNDVPLVGEKATDSSIGSNTSTDTMNDSSKEEATAETNNDNQLVTEESTSNKRAKREVSEKADVYGWSYTIVYETNYRFLTKYTGDPEHIKIPSRIGGYNVLVDLSDGLARYGIDKTKVKTITFVDEGASSEVAGICKQLADYIMYSGGSTTPRNGNKITFSGFTNLESIDFSGFSFDEPNDTYNCTNSYWDFREMFAGDTKLKSVSFNSKHGWSWKWNEIIRMKDMFKDCVSLEKVDMSFLVSADGNGPKQADFETGTFSNTPALKEVNFNGSGSRLNFNGNILFESAESIFGTSNSTRKNLKLLVPKGNEVANISNEDWSNKGIDPIGAGITLNTSAGTFSNGQQQKTYMYNVVNPSIEDLPAEASFEQPILEEGKVLLGWDKTSESVLFDLPFSTYSANIVESDWTWTKNEDNTVTLNSYIGKSTDIVVPNEIAGMPTQIALSSGIDARGLGEDSWTKVTSITFSNANGKKVKLLDNRIKFNNWSSLKSFDGRGLDTAGLTSLTDLFGNNTKLENVNVDDWDTSQVNSYKYAFNHNHSLKTISGLNTWDVSKGENFYGTFNECHSLQRLDLSNWVTSSATEMMIMFNKTFKLTSLNVSKFDTSHVTNFKWMFGATAIENLDLSNFDISSATNMYGMFEQAVNLSQLDISHFKTDKVDINMGNMFRATPKLRVVDMRGFTNIDQQDTANILGTIASNSEISVIGEPEAAIGKPLMVISPEGSRFSQWNFVKESGRVPLELPKVVSNNLNYTFDNNQISKSYLSTITVVPSTLEIATFTNWLNAQTPNKTIDKKFYYVKDVTPSKDTSSAKSVLDLIDTTYTVNVLESDWEFQLDKSDGTYKLNKYLGDQPNIVVPNTIDGISTKINLSAGIKTPNLPGVAENSVSGVQSITFDSSNNRKVKLSGNRIAFNNFRDLRTFDGSGLDTTGLQSLKDLFNNNQLLETAEVSSWNTSQVENMEGAFNNCYKLSQLDIEDWNMSQVSNMKWMFRDARQLNFLDLRLWNLASNVDMTEVFLAPYTSKPLLVIATDEKLLDYDYKKDNRTFSGPFFDANAGSFKDGESRKAYFTKNAVTPEDELLKLETVYKFARENIPLSSNKTFTFWGRNLESITDVLKALDTIIYAQWQYIPYENDNIATQSFEYGVAYIPKLFNFSKTELKDSGTQSIPAMKKNEFHIGVIDRRNENTQWTLTGQLIWNEGQSIPGSCITTTTSGQVNKNINNGTEAFKPSDLVSAGRIIQGVSNVSINTEAPEMIMKTSTSGIKNGVFDVNLGEVSLNIEDTRIIQPGTYTGYVEWNLINGPQ